MLEKLNFETVQIPCKLKKPDGTMSGFLRLFGSSESTTKVDEEHNLCLLSEETMSLFPPL